MINYKFIDDSIKFYESKGFSRIEAPWTVSEGISNLTKPADRINFVLEHNRKCLVASGEQSFLYLYNKGFLPKGRYQTVTPCFRYEAFDEIHTKYFIKNELIITDKVDEGELMTVINYAKEFFETIFGKNTVEIEKTDIGYDLIYKGIELGSYGIRHFSFLGSYIYATGLAEPRTSYCLNLK